MQLSSISSCRAERKGSKRLVGRMQEKLEVLQDAQVSFQLLRFIKNYFSVFASRANMCNCVILVQTVVLVMNV